MPVTVPTSARTREGHGIIDSTDVKAGKGDIGHIMP
jgi:hypothetical protein